MVDAAIEVRLSDGDAKALRETAAREGVSPGEIIRRALRAYREASRMMRKVSGQAEGDEWRSRRVASREDA